MGKTYKKQSTKFDDGFPSGRSGKHAKHSNGRKTGGMKTLNSYVDDDYDLNDEDFDDEVEINDDIIIQRNKNDDTY